LVVKTFDENYKHIGEIQQHSTKEENSLCLRAHSLPRHEPFPSNQPIISQQSTFDMFFPHHRSFSNIIRDYLVDFYLNLPQPLTELNSYTISCLSFSLSLQKSLQLNNRFSRSEKKQRVGE
jgi:hypothetical protein